MFIQPFIMAAMGNVHILCGPIIVGMMAAIAIPSYARYVETARLTEATSIMVAIITLKGRRRRGQPPSTVFLWLGG
jgi:type II secretory pathway pseudopilin PulG